MKKIIALILVVGCVLSLASCQLFGKDPSKDNNDPDDSVSISSIQEKIDASAPKGASITVAFATKLGDLNGSYDVAYNEDGTASVDYSYEKFNTFTDGETSSELKSTVSGNVTVAVDGSVSGDLGAEGLTAVSFDLSLEEGKLSNVVINAGVLSADVKAEDTAAVLGVALNYDAKLSVSTGTNGITSLSVTYTTNNGEVEIVTTYNY